MMKEKVGEGGRERRAKTEWERGGRKKGREKNRGQEEGEGGLETREEKNDDAYCLPQPGN